MKTKKILLVKKMWLLSHLHLPEAYHPILFGWSSGIWWWKCQQNVEVTFSHKPAKPLTQSKHIFSKITKLDNSFGQFWMTKKNVHANLCSTFYQKRLDVSPENRTDWCFADFLKPLIQDVAFCKKFYMILVHKKTMFLPRNLWKIFFDFKKQPPRHVVHSLTSRCISTIRLFVD